jgi:hypothetical protein
MNGSPWPATIPACGLATPWPPTTRTGSTGWRSPRPLSRGCPRPRPLFANAHLNNALWHFAFNRLAAGDAPRFTPGCTGSPPTGASTRAARPAAVRPKSGTCPTWSRPSRPGSAKWYGSSRILTPPRGRVRCAARPGGPLRADRSHLPGLRHRPSGPAAPPGRGPHLARRPRIPRQRGGRHARLDRRIGHQCPSGSSSVSASNCPK